MADDDEKYTRTTPPEPHEWPKLWLAIERAHASWLIVGPIHALVTNWRAWVVVAGGVSYLKGDAIALAVKAFLEGAP